MSNQSESFGELLRRLRVRAALSQEALAERAGLSARGISDLERGVRRAPHLHTVGLLAEALALGAGERDGLLTAARAKHDSHVSTGVGDGGRSRMPRPLTPFIGRGRELAAVTTLLQQPEVRLLTLTGSGGIGKTRLALESAARLAGGFPDGTVFVDLAPLHTGDLVLTEIASALRLRGAAERPLIEIVRSYLAEREMLLMLDNFEHVLDGSPVVTELLAASERTKVLATSRAPLRLQGEREYPVPSLGLPVAGAKTDLTSLAASEAVMFFVDRAQAVRPDFALTPDNASAVAEICYRLDGLPLAIELAAARVKVLPPRTLLNRLEQQLPMLTGGARSLPARQQTMRDTIAWSHDLLLPTEQTIFRRLAACPGGFTLEAAEWVAGSPDGRVAGTSSVLDGIASLLDEGLLRQVEGAEGEPRFRMLETVREYGLEQLEASGESDATRGWLAAWCLTLAEHAEPVDFGGDMLPTWVARLDEELPNLRAAVDWLLERGEATRALRLLVATEDFWTQRLTSHAELHRWLEAALAASPDAPARDQVLAHWLLSTGHGAQGNEEAALFHARRLLAAAEAAGDSASLGFAHMALAYAWEDRGDIARAAAAYAATIPVWWDAGAWYPKAQLADKLIMQGDLEAGVPMLDEALSRLRQGDPHWWIVLVIILRGHAALRQGDLSLAASLFAEAITNARDLHHMPALLGAMAGMAGVALGRGQAERAAWLLGAVEAARESVGIKYIRSWLHADLITADARAALAAEAFERAWSVGGAVPMEEAITEALAVASEVGAGIRR